MGRKKTRAADIRRRLIDDDKDISPFASIRLVEKKEEKKSAPKKTAPAAPRKKPSEIVQGYDPSSSFADILYSFEHTGNPYSMPHPTKGESRSAKMDFGAILDKWEGKGKAKARPSGNAQQKKSVYTPTRSFADILSSYEGGGKPAAQPVPPVKKESPQDKKSTVKETPEPLLSDNLFRSPEEGESLSSSASWSIFGGRNESFVRPEKEEKKEEVKAEEPAVRTEVRKNAYKPTKSFADILSSYEGKSPKREEEKPEAMKPQAAVSEEKPLSDNLFKTPEDGEKRAEGVAWSVFGGNEGFVRPKKEAEPALAGDRKEERPAYEPSFPFGTILERYAASPKEKTFEEYMKEKGDEDRKKESLTISKLRAMPPQSTLDLHGYTAKEAEDAVRSFLSECRDNKIRKVSIITGKGLHSEDGVGVLRSTVQTVLDESGLVSEKANAPISAGGSGALWIILKA